MFAPGPGPGPGPACLCVIRARTKFLHSSSEWRGLACQWRDTVIVARQTGRHCTALSSTLLLLVLPSDKQCREETVGEDKEQNLVNIKSSQGLIHGRYPGFNSQHSLMITSVASFLSFATSLVLTHHCCCQQLAL